MEENYEIEDIVNELKVKEYVKNAVKKKDEDIIIKIFWLCDQDKNKVWQAVQNQRSEKDSNLIMSNLVQMYPISKRIIEKILGIGDKEFTSEDFLSYYDQTGEILNTIQKNVDAARNEYGGTKAKVDKYIEDIEKIKKDIEALEEEKEGYQASKNENKELIDKKEKLQRDVARLKQQCDPKRLQSEIKKLKEEKEELQKKLDEHKLDLDVLKDDISELKDDLEDAREDESTTGKFEDALRQLQKTVKEIK